MAKKKVRRGAGVVPRRKEDDSKVFAFVVAFLSIVGFIIALIAKKDDEYVMHYAKQSLVVFIVAVIAGVISAVVGWVPVVGWIISLVLNVFVFVAWVLSWVYALSGAKKEVPIVGQYARVLKI